jgi:hypothetical protein
MNVKNEEVVPLADMLYASFKRDQVEIEGENSFYSTTFLANFSTEIEIVRKFEKKNALLVDQKKLTSDLYKIGDDLKKPLRLFEIVIKKAEVPTNLISEIIKKINNRNFEGVIEDIKALIQVINSNKALLESKSMKPTFPSFLQSSLNQLTEKSNSQTKLQKQGSDLTDSNNVSYDKLYKDYIVDICTIGKVVYGGKKKASDYTISKMLKYLHVTQPNKTKEISSLN